ncbi:glycosyltransferase [Diaminobutyricimonas sp. TR449]|uniref:glycosyltransferase n=1 Tax=Diaminobutyricimonas sp. TR449 TaxID=2708076 RepID=UPI001421C3CB|nr:glycosyltransferase [Diaminobutyricimonas sp. TR449]
MTSPLPRFSIVVNTLNRASMLERTLQSFQWLNYDGEFEIVVVNGPSTDETPEVLRRWSDRIRIAHCDVPNLSVSRNVGIQAAQGDIVAFIDDDAIPEPGWLTALAEAYNSPEVGGAGGFVFDHTGYSYQYQYAEVDRLGHADLAASAPTPDHCFPSSFVFPHLLGANSSFRRAALVEIGGFDEEFEYYLDESDVHVRLIDAGYVIAQVPHAVVHHHFAPSNMRGANRVSKSRYSVLKNKLYFSILHARGYMSLEEIMEDHRSFIAHQRQDVTWAVSEGLLTEEDLDQFQRDVDSSMDAGLRNGLRGPTPRRVDVRSPQGEFLPYRALTAKPRLNVVLLSQDYPPGTAGGVATFTRDLAKSLSSLGHDVHVVTRSPDINRVDYEFGVWVHRLLPESHVIPAGMVVPQHLWDWSATALTEVRRLHDRQPVDVVEAPIWDVEGIAFLHDSSWPLVTSLQTTLETWLDTHAAYREDETWMASFAEPVLAAERALMVGSDGVRAISEAIQRDIADLYDLEFPDDKLVVAHLGVSDPITEGIPETLSVPARVPSNPQSVAALFVGRLEGRKGIDVLLDAFAIAHQKNPDLTLNVVGDDTIEGDGGRTPKEEFLAAGHPSSVYDAVRFLGKVTDAQLALAYSNSSFLVAPSRYESFGLIFVEAMSHGLATVGTRIGGIPEIVDHEETGILVDPDNVEQLAEALVRISTDRPRRDSWGARGRAKFERDFTAEAMAERSVPLYELAIRNKLARKDRHT